MASYNAKPKYLPGETVRWRGAWGTQPEKIVAVIGHGEKNGQIVYDLDNGHWCYADQLKKY